MLDLLNSLIDLMKTNPLAGLMVIIAFIVLFLLVGALIAYRWLGRGIKRDETTAAREKEAADFAASREKARDALTDKIMEMFSDKLGDLTDATKDGNKINTDAYKKQIDALSDIKKSLVDDANDTANDRELQRVAIQDQTTVGKKTVESLNTLSEKTDKLIEVTQTTSQQHSERLDGIQPAFVEELSKSRETAVQIIANNTAELVKPLVTRLDENATVLEAIDTRLEALPDAVAKRLETTLSEVRASIDHASQQLTDIETAIKALPKAKAPRIQVVQ